jgi:hypothetical protein
MILIGSALLFAIGMLLLSVQAIRIAFELIKLAYYLAKMAVLLTIAVICAGILFCQWFAKHVMILVRWFKGIPEPIEPEPVITINFALGDNAPTIELPRSGFRRLRG